MLQRTVLLGPNDIAHVTYSLTFRGALIFTCIGRWKQALPPYYFRLSGEDIRQISHYNSFYGI